MRGVLRMVAAGNGLCGSGGVSRNALGLATPKRVAALWRPNRASGLSSIYSLKQRAAAA